MGGEMERDGPIQDNGGGLHALANALRANEKRKRKSAALWYASIVMLGALVSGFIYFAQLQQIHVLNQRGYESCLNRNQQIRAEIGYWKVVTLNSSSTEVRKAAVVALAAMPVPRDCSSAYDITDGSGITDGGGSSPSASTTSP